ncbi:MAG TPA: hypothetical protein PKK32_01090 [Candidatus Paceibacterota bacterium]|nr:hypothetical protein [Candidatus Paceibacterota bacterium]HQM18663.1 hypothetical protein [Candidatus Paceibacterota bacterium]
MENLFIMKKLKKYSDHLKEVIRRMREKDRVEKMARELTSGARKIVLVKGSSVSILAHTVDSVEQHDTVIPWHQFYDYVEYIENKFDIPVEMENGLKEAIDIARGLAKKYPQLAPLELVEIDPEDII